MHVGWLPIDGKRCAKTIHSIFDNASDPDKVTIGLIEQNAPTDDFCIDEYCKTYGKCVLSLTDISLLLAEVLDDSKRRFVLLCLSRIRDTIVVGRLLSSAFLSLLDTISYVVCHCVSASLRCWVWFCRCQVRQEEDYP